MGWTSRVRVALVTYLLYEPTIWTLLTGAAELFGVVAFFFLVCLSELFD